MTFLRLRLRQLSFAFRITSLHLLWLHLNPGRRQRPLHEHLLHRYRQLRLSQIYLITDRSQPLALPLLYAIYLWEC